ncbi:hypothetical protein CLIB1423_01S05600 [[Candida] railenensis]|uniref:SnoaL-like domain-containing protein n=1 Tax=[Candida] railenensis TaxID=45579 RepID=A0A9P0QJF0_9ASCO|nr:hypothetical protein CLIB1423_01S05600 [[Candida] railenensis]
MSEQLIRDFFDAINQRDYSRIKTYITEDYIYHLDEDHSWTGYQATIMEQLKPFIEKDQLFFKIIRIEDEGDTFLVWSTKESAEAGDQLEQYAEKFLIQNGKIAEQWMLGRK